MGDSGGGDPIPIIVAGTVASDENDDFPRGVLIEQAFLGVSNGVPLRRLNWPSMTVFFCDGEDPFREGFAVACFQEKAPIVVGDAVGEGVVEGGRFIGRAAVSDEVQHDEEINSGATFV